MGVRGHRGVGLLRRGDAHGLDAAALFRARWGEPPRRPTLDSDLGGVLCRELLHGLDLRRSCFHERGPDPPGPLRQRPRLPPGQGGHAARASF